MLDLFLDRGNVEAELARKLVPETEDELVGEGLVQVRIESLERWLQAADAEWWSHDRFPLIPPALQRRIAGEAADIPAITRLRYDWLKPGRTQLWVRPLGAAVAPQLLDVVLEPGTTTEVTLRFKSAPTIRGRVMDPSERGFAGALVQARFRWDPLVEGSKTKWRRGRYRELPESWGFRFEKDHIVVETPTNERGHFELLGLPPSEVELTVDYFGQRIYDAPLRDRPDELRIVTNALRPDVIVTVSNHSVRGMMWRRYDRGDRWRLFDIELRGFGGTRLERRIKWPQRAAFYGVPEGATTILCVGGGREDYRPEVAVAECVVRRGETQLVELASFGSARVIFRVADHATGKPIAVSVETRVLDRKIAIDDYHDRWVDRWIRHSIAAGVPQTLVLSAPGYQPRGVRVTASVGEELELGWLCLEPTDNVTRGD